MTDIVEGFDGLEAYLQQVAENVANADYGPDLSGLVPELRELHAGYFEGQHDPNGEAWKPLAASTVKAKGHSTILVDTNAMRESLLQPGNPNGIVEAHRTELLFGTHDPKAIFHQEGTQNMPARPFVGLTDDFADRVAEVIGDSAAAQAIQ